MPLLASSLLSLQQEHEKARATIASLRQTHSLSFEVRTARRGLGPETSDPLTIQFSDQSASAIQRPEELSAIYEVTFPGKDAPSDTTYSFVRNARGRQFLDARYIRVLNYGSNGWQGEWLSLKVDGTLVLNKVKLSPLPGNEPLGEIEDFNKDDWEDRKYWEAELQPLRKDK